MFGFHLLELIPLLLGFVVPWIIGFTYIPPDANRRGQPGLLWALLTLPLGWITVLAYAVVRALQSPTALR
jgi:hypothetical protein